MWFLTPEQNGFRKQRGAVDHLIRLESYIRDAFAHRQYVIEIFVDLYDTTWKYGILQGLKIVVLKDTYRYLSRIISVITHFKYDLLPHVRVI